MKSKPSSGQSIIEYIILIAMIIAALMVFLGRGGIFEQSYEGIISEQGDGITEMSEQIFN